MTRTVPLVIAAFNEAMVQGIAGALRAFVHPNDEIDLVSGNHDNPLSVPNVNRWSGSLASVLPPGTLFAVHTSGLDHVTTLAQQAAPAVHSILLDYEPDWDPQFTWEFRPTLAHFDQFTAICRQAGRRAVAYPTGRPIQNPALLGYAWDYAEMLAHADDVYPQTQHWATVGPEAWATALSTLRAQRARHGLDPRALVAQLTVGPDKNGVPADAAVQRYQAAVKDGLRRLYVWWTPGGLGEVTKFLAAIDG